MIPVDRNNHRDLHKCHTEDMIRRRIKLRYPDNLYMEDNLHRDMGRPPHMDLEHSWGKLTPVGLDRRQILLDMGMVVGEEYMVDMFHHHIVVDMVYMVVRDNLRVELVGLVVILILE